MKDDGTIYVTKFDGYLLMFALNLLIAVGVDCFFWAGPGDFLSLSVLELSSALCCHGYGIKKYVFTSQSSMFDFRMFQAWCLKLVYLLACLPGIGGPTCLLTSLKLSYVLPESRV